MSDISKQLHSLTFTDQSTGQSANTWDDWNLVPSSRPSFAMPKLKEYSQDIPGANGKIDLSSSLTGYESYENRSGSIEFIVMNQDLDTSLGDRYGYNTNANGWTALKAKIANFIHGKQMKVEYEDMTNWYFLGRISVNEWKSDERYSTITLDYDLEPYKYSVTSTNDQWLWDPFNFETGVIRTYNEDTMKFSGSGSFEIIGTACPVVPTIFVTSACTLTTPKGTFSLRSGSNKDPRILVYPGSQRWVFSGATGSAAVYYRERSL